MTAAGASMLTIGALGGPREMALAAIGPLCGGLPNLVMGLIYRAKHAGDKTEPIMLTPEARILLVNLSHHIRGWGSPWKASSPHNMAGVGMGSHLSAAPRQDYGRRSPVRRSLATIAGQVELDGLEQAAHEYNRIAGVLAAGSSGSAMLAKMSQRVTRAADEVMADALHQAALVAKYPEGASAARQKLTSLTDNLRELADRIERVSNEQTSITDKVAYRSSIDDVLDELRMEQVARDELRLAENQDQRA